MYIHFPWCVSKCPYCDFYSVVGVDSIPHEEYAEAVIAEFVRRHSEIEPGQLRSVYFGGGTPSLWEPKSLGRVLDRILSEYQLAARDVEITLECNPSSYELRKCEEWHRIGVNRLSLGIQSLNDRELQFLGRAHDSSQAMQALELGLHSGIDNIGGDFIFGLPNQDADGCVEQLRRLPLAELSHISAYALTIEPNTHFGALARRGRLPVAPDDAVVESFLAIHEMLCANNFEHYEISNYAKPARRSLHNAAYWRGCDYIGLGCAAWGTVQLSKTAASGSDSMHLRYRNTTRIPGYLAGVQAGSLWEVTPVGILSELEAIDSATALVERIMLGLRTCDGIDLSELESEFDVSDWCSSKTTVIERLVQNGRLAVDERRLTIPFSAWCLADGTIAQLI